MDILTIDLDIIPSVRLIGHVNYNIPWKHFTRTTDEYIMYFIKSGELCIREGDRIYDLRKGDMLLLEPDKTHTGIKEACCHYYYIHFRHSGISGSISKTTDEIIDELAMKRKLSITSDVYSENLSIDSIYYLPKLYHFENDSELFSRLAEIDFDFYQKFENYKRITSLRFSELLIGICKQFTTTKIENSKARFSKSFIKVRDILNYLERNYSKKITSSDIEELCEYNFDYLNRAFQKVTGHTIFNYLNFFRIKRAQDLILSTSLKYSEIGYLVGIDDPYYFSRLFKKYTGMTASQYARNGLNIDH